MLAAFGSALFSAAGFLIIKHVLKNLIKDAVVFVFFFNVFNALIGMLFWLKVPFCFPSLETMGIIFLTSIFAFVGFFFNYIAFLKGDISTTGPLMGLKIPFVALSSYLLLGERHGALVYLGVFLSMVSVGLLSWEDRNKLKAKPKIGRPVLLMILATVLYAFSDTAIKVGLRKIDSWNFSVHYLIVVGLLSLFIYPFIRNCPEIKLTPRAYGYLVLASLFMVGMTVLFFLSFKGGGNITIPNILLSSRGILVVLATFVLAHMAKNPILESQSRGTYVIRLMGAVLMTVAVALVVMKS